MKKTLLALLLAAPLLAPAQTPISYTVSGKIGNLNAPATIFLFGPGSPDSVVLKNGAFEFKGTSDRPFPATIVLRRTGQSKDLFAAKERLRFYLEPTPVVITSADSLLEGRAKVVGGPLTADDQKLSAAMQAVIEKSRAFSAEAGKTTEVQRRDSAFAARMQASFDAIGKAYVQVYARFIRENPTSWVSLYSLYGMKMLETPQYAVVGPLYNALSPELKNSRMGRDYGDMVDKLKDLAIGSPAPGFTQNTPEGKPVSLAGYRGKYVLVDFWASWCGPCRTESPAIAKVYNQYKGRNFDILSVSLDDGKGRAKWLKAITDDHLTWTQVSDLRGWQNQAAQLYGVRSIPQNYLIGPDGKILAANLKGEELKTTLAKLIK
ncbi:TlpA disulfide reductase family protein [Hymenobacter negativus]|uniref:AhpC/TSA family protein n=1 Tax=Hymenobacter negativus TaxID=2795026 RepID=A0ABS3QA10_9BACT|nr:TlpA disulfide reductase family protein [Hymenobacter negativus]MBO2007823.1 AhpC/TSA family protein [Hymenobacter negativus]